MLLAKLRMGMGPPGTCAASRGSLWQDCDGDSHCHSSPATALSSPAQCSGKWPSSLEASRLPDGL